MKKLKFLILFGILILTSKLFSQTVTTGDLIGNWKWGSGKHYRILNFENDRIYSIIANYSGGLFGGGSAGNPKMFFKFDSLNNEYFLQSTYKYAEPRWGAYYGINRIDKDHFTLQLFKEIEFRYHSLQEVDFHDKSIDTLVRLK
jgi:hypothetical protein